MASKLTPELLEKAKQAKTAEDLIVLAKENGTEMTEESAKAYFDQLHKTGELADEELNNVSGGACHTDDGRKIVTVGHDCTRWKCKKCGGSPVGTNIGHCNGCGKLCCCDTCCFCTYEKGLWLCNYGY